MSSVEGCYVCDSPNIRFYKEVNGFDVYRCNVCGLLWVQAEDRVDEIKSFYGEGYFLSESRMGYRDYFADEANHRRDARNIINIVSKVRDISGLRVLDIGCAGGFLLDECRKLKGCNAYGVEVSSYAYEHAKKLGLNVINSDFDSSLFEPQFFDVAFLLGTVEHLVSPAYTMHDVRRVLKPGGMLVITTIDTRGLFPLYSIKPPEHLFYFNHRNLALLLNNTGYQVELRKTYFASYYLHDLFHRLKEFSSISFFGLLSSFAGKYLPWARFRIPTNEMIVIASKGAPEAGAYA